MANEPENKKVAVRIGRPNGAAAAATRKLPTPRLVRKARFAKDVTFPGVAFATVKGELMLTRS
jgi:hypothetical protein